MTEMVLTTAADAASALDHAEAQIRAGEVAKCVAIAALCDLHRIDETALVEGAERLIQGGGDGTPVIGEFVAGEIAGLLGISIPAAFDRISTVLNLRHRHPTLWHLLTAGQIRWWDAARIARDASLAGLDAQACARFDKWCETALRFQPWSRVRRQVEKWLIQADPEKALEREEARHAGRYLNVGDIESGHVGVWGQLDAADGIALDQALDQLADSLDDNNVVDLGAGRAAGKDQRRAIALGIMARETLGQALLPTRTANPPANPTLGRPTSPRRAELIIHLDGGDLNDTDSGVAHVDHWGHLRLGKLPELLTGCHITIRPVVGGDMPAVDSYQVPDAMRLALEARNPTDVFPYGNKPSSQCDLDHTIPFNHRDRHGTGQTRPGNLGPLSRFAHRLKTHGGWQCEQPAPGCYLWRSPLGYQYLVTAQGTAMVHRPPPREHRWWEVEPPFDDPPEHPVPPEYLVPPEHPASPDDLAPPGEAA